VVGLKFDNSCRNHLSARIRSLSPQAVCSRAKFNRQVFERGHQQHASKKIQPDFTRISAFEVIDCRMIYRPSTIFQSHLAKNRNVREQQTQEYPKVGLGGTGKTKWGGAKNAREATSQEFQTSPTSPSQSTVKLATHFPRSLDRLNHCH
jgi:hypothetical protein